MSFHLKVSWGFINNKCTSMNIELHFRMHVALSASLYVILTKFIGLFLYKILLN